MSNIKYSDYLLVAKTINFEQLSWVFNKSKPILRIKLWKNSHSV